MGSECKGARVGIGGDGVCAGDGAGVIDATLLSPSRESSLSRTMPSADEAMVEDGRGRVQAYRPERAVTPALWRAPRSGRRMDTQQKKNSRVLGRRAGGKTSWAPEAF